MRTSRKVRAERAVTEAGTQAKKNSYKVATADRGKRGWKRQSPEEAGALEPKAKVARMSEAVEEDEIAPAPWRDSLSGADVAAEDAEDETATRGIELGSV